MAITSFLALEEMEESFSSTAAVADDDVGDNGVNGIHDEQEMEMDVFSECGQSVKEEEGPQLSATMNSDDSDVEVVMVEQR